MNKLSRAPLERFRVIAQLLQDGKLHRANELAARLETCPKTIYRDLEFMRDRLGVPIESVVGRGYSISHQIKLCPLCTGRMNHEHRNQNHGQ